MHDLGTPEKPSTIKKGYKLPRAPMTNSDLTRLINSDEIQSIVRQPKAPKRGRPLKKNPLKNLGALLKLNPYAKTARRHQLLNQVWHSASARAHSAWCCKAGMIFCSLSLVSEKA